MITNPSGTVCWPGGARGLHTSPDCDRTCLCCSCDSHCFVPLAMETRFKTTAGDVTLPPGQTQGTVDRIDGIDVRFRVEPVPIRGNLIR